MLPLLPNMQTTARFGSNSEIGFLTRIIFPMPKSFLAKVIEKKHPITFYAIANEQEAIGSIGINARRGCSTVLHSRIGLLVS